MRRSRWAKFVHGAALALGAAGLAWLLGQLSFYIPVALDRARREARRCVGGGLAAVDG